MARNGNPSQPYNQTETRQIESWVFDLDNTLYQANHNFFVQIVQRMNNFVADYLNLDMQAALAVQKDYLVKYGTTLSGLMEVHGMNPDDFLAYVHDVDLSLLSPDPLLRQAIAALSGRKFIYTNGSRAHARNVATRLNLFDLFDGHFGIEDGEYIPKPQAAPYDICLEKFDIDPTRAAFFEDNLRNLKVPKTLGFYTVLVTSPSEWHHEPKESRPAKIGTKSPFVDASTDNLAQYLIDWPQA